MENIEHTTEVTNSEDQKVKKGRKQKASFLDHYEDDIRYYLSLEISVAAIAKIINEKLPVKLTANAYRHFIQSRL